MIKTRDISVTIECNGRYCNCNCDFIGDIDDFGTWCSLFIEQLNKDIFREVIRCDKCRNEFGL
jgi:hypothetical protein